MGHFAKVNNGIVEQVIVADVRTMQALVIVTTQRVMRSYPRNPLPHGL